MQACEFVQQEVGENLTMSVWPVSSMARGLRWSVNTAYELVSLKLRPQFVSALTGVDEKLCRKFGRELGGISRGPLPHTIDQAARNPRDHIELSLFYKNYCRAAEGIDIVDGPRAIETNIFLTAFYTTQMMCGANNSLDINYCLVAVHLHTEYMLDFTACPYCHTQFVTVDYPTYISMSNCPYCDAVGRKRSGVGIPEEKRIRMLAKHAGVESLADIYD